MVISLNIKLKLRGKIAAIIFLLMAFNLIILIILGNTFFDRFYTSTKVDQLKQGAQYISNTYTNDIDELPDLIEQLEGKNIKVCLFSINNKYVNIEYYTRRGFGLPNANAEIIPLINYLYRNNILAQLDKGSKVYTINIEKDDLDNESMLQTNNLAVVAKIQDNSYVLTQTPKQFIQEVANSMLRYITIVSVFTLILSALVVFFTSEHITRPIRKIQLAADKIAHLDFSSHCDEGIQDELGMLGASINNMSDRLQANISQLMEANEVLKNDLLRKEQTDKIRRQFIANVSHDFKTPLTLIISYAEKLRDSKSLDEDHEDLNIILSEGRKMNTMVQRLLQLSQLESGMTKIEKTIFSANELISDIVKKYSLLAEKKEIDLNYDVNEEIIVSADYFSIGQAISNILENALKYTPEKGRIHISTHIQENGKCRLVIYNSGSHLPEESVSNLFDSFYRADPARSRDTQNYGLGLAIVKATMEMHQEAFGANNTEDGVEFWIELERFEFDDNDEDLDNDEAELPEEVIDSSVKTLDDEFINSEAGSALNTSEKITDQANADNNPNTTK